VEGVRLFAELLEHAVGHESAACSLLAKNRGPGVPQTAYVSRFIDQIIARPELRAGFEAAMTEHMDSSKDAGVPISELLGATYEDCVGNWSAVAEDAPAGPGGDAAYAGFRAMMLKPLAPELLAKDRGGQTSVASVYTVRMMRKDYERRGVFPELRTNSEICLTQVVPVRVAQAMLVDAEAQLAAGRHPSMWGRLARELRVQLARDMKAAQSQEGAQGEGR
jgi:hypothetical protein